MSDNQRKEFLETRKEFLNLLKTIKAELQAFQIMEGEVFRSKICLN
jgi:hypothetical protein